jgi:hypothetical protein
MIMTQMSLKFTTQMKHALRNELSIISIPPVGCARSGRTGIVQLFLNRGNLALHSHAQLKLSVNKMHLEMFNNFSDRLLGDLIIHNP